jgi:23S rRNA (uridine2552-2'-O)-methyltransferase
MTWINRHVKDPYVKSATTDNLRSRSAYKLMEINDKYKILSETNNNNHNGGMFVIDLGSTPGGWSLVASRYVDIVKVDYCYPLIYCLWNIYQVTNISYIMMDDE